MKAGIAVDDWKLPIFIRHLTQANFKFTTAQMTDESSLLSVEVENLHSLEVVVIAATAEAAKTRAH